MRSWTERGSRSGFRTPTAIGLPVYNRTLSSLKVFEVNGTPIADQSRIHKYKNSSGTSEIYAQMLVMETADIVTNTPFNTPRHGYCRQSNDLKKITFLGVTSSPYGGGFLRVARLHIRSISIFLGSRRRHGY